MKSAFCIVFGVLVAMAAHSSPELEAGPLGAVEVGEGEAVHIRSLLSLTGAPSLGAALHYGIELAYGELGLRRMASVHDGDPYTTSLVSAFADAFRARGGQVVAEAGIEKGDTDMTAVLAEFAGAGPDGVFFPLFLGEGSAFALQAREFDGLHGATLITGAAMLVSEFLGSPQSEGIYLGPETPHGSIVNAATGKDADTVLAAFEATYGESPTSPLVDAFAWKGRKLNDEVARRGGWEELIWGGQADSQLGIEVDWKKESDQPASYATMIRGMEDGGAISVAESVAANGTLLIERVEDRAHVGKTGGRSSRRRVQHSAFLFQ